MGFIIVIVARFGDDGDPVPEGSTNGKYLNGIVSFAFFFIVIVQLIGILLGDKTPISVIIFGSVVNFTFYVQHLRAQVRKA